MKIITETEFAQQDLRLDMAESYQEIICFIQFGIAGVVRRKFYKMQNLLERDTFAPIVMIITILIEDH